MPEASSAEAAARQLYEQQTAAGQRVTGASLGRAIGRSERYGRLLLAEFRAQDGASALRSGNGGPGRPGPQRQNPTTTTEGR